MMPVIGYEGRYGITKTGKVWAYPNLSRNKGRWLVQCVSKCGYLYVCLFKDGKRKNKYVHALVADAFLGERNGLQVNHIDGDKKNNMISNLEFVTASRNRKHAYEIGIQIVTQKQREASRRNITEYNSREAIQYV